MPGYGQEKIQMIMDFDSGNRITLAANAMKQAQGLLQRPTTSPQTPDLTKEIEPVIIEDKVIKQETLETIPDVTITAVPKEEPISEEIINNTVTPGGYEPGKATNLSEDLVTSESSGRYNVVNKEGYMGAYQFGDARLTDYKNATKTKFSNNDFINNKELQDKVFNWHKKDIESNITNSGFDKYIGTNILDIPVTQSGLIAVAHLGGKEGMKKFLESGGKYNPADSNGTTLSNYLDKFKDSSNENN